MPLGILAIILIISGPSMLLAWLSYEDATWDRFWMLMGGQ